MESIQDKAKYNFIETMQEIDHELASRAVEVIRARTQAHDDDFIRGLLVRYKLAMRRNMGLIDDILEGLGETYE